MATTQTTFDKVSNIIQQTMGIEEAEIKPEASLVDDLGADSLDSVELVMGVEEEFEIEIPDDDAEKFKTVNDIVAYVDKHK